MENILEMRSIIKTFPGVKALDNVNLSVKQGEIHALVGENGAGKSTLMNVLCGVYPYGSYSGNILYNGEECKFKGIKDSERVGIVIIHQELALVPYLSIAENMFLGNEQHKNQVINWQLTDKKAKECLDKVRLKEKTSTLIVDIGVGKQQLVEIAKALAKDVKLLILDEPTAALNDEDSGNLLNLLRELKRDGITCVLISHKLKEVASIADSITVLRDGATIETLVAGRDDITEDRIIKGMVGRDLHDYYPKRLPEDGYTIGGVFFEIRDWCVEHPELENKNIVNNVNINVKKGEIVGISGLMGAGRTEFAMSLFGKMYGNGVSGTVLKHGNKISTNTVREAIKNGIAYVSEDRKTYGLILIHDIKQNISLVNLASICNRFGVLDTNKNANVAEHYRKAFNIKTPSVHQIAGNLSGGNQQKVVLSKWIFAEPDLLILDEPTRGIDVGAKYEIYTIINQMAKEGKSIILISSEMPEILGMCDRVYVMNEGEIVGELDKTQASQESIMKCIMQSAAGEPSSLKTEAVT